MSKNTLILPILETSLNPSTDKKNAPYYIIVGLFVTTTVVSTLLTAAFIVLSILLWSHFKNLNLSNRNGILLIDIERFEFYRPYIFTWLSAIWLLPLGIDYVLMTAGCRIQINRKLGKFRMKCETYSNSILIHDETPIEVQVIDTLLQIGLPAFILFFYVSIVLSIAFARNLSLKDHEKTILKQAVFTFVVFQAPSLVFQSANFFHIEELEAFLIKRFVNTMEIFGGIATPSFFFFTSQEVRKIMTSRVYATNSDNSADIVQRNRIRAAA